jgi:hypothetical protein
MTEAEKAASAESSIRRTRGLRGSERVEPEQIQPVCAQGIQEICFCVSQTLVDEPLHSLLRGDLTGLAATPSETIRCSPLPIFVGRLIQNSPTLLIVSIGLHMVGIRAKVGGFLLIGSVIGTAENDDL